MLPAIVIGGYLGAGKTTLLNRLLREAGGHRIAVMVNDFGEVGIDADLIVSREADLMNLAGGCVCCAVGSDLIEALVALPTRDPPFDLVLVETSGVALPGAVARSIRLAAGIDVDGVVVLADAETVRRRADDRYVGDTVRQQLAEADLLVLNKVDLVDAATRIALRTWLADAAPRAAIVEAIDANLPTEAVFGPDARRAAPGGTAGWVLGPIRPPPAATAVFEQVRFDIVSPLDPGALAAALADPALRLIRAKGTFRNTDGQRWVVQAVGARVRVSRADEGSRAAHDAPEQLVAIGLRGTLSPESIAARLGSGTLHHDEATP
jgi:G3E family GTPase